VDLMQIVIVIASAVAVLSLASTVQALLKLNQKRKEPTLEDRISNLTKNLKSSAALITELETEISKRKLIAQQLEAEIEGYNKLKEIDRAQVEAIAQIMNIPLKKESRKSLIINVIVTIVVAFIFFAIVYVVGGR
jgi:hypothetical protein